MTWRYALASVVGTSHLKLGQSCQDYSACTILRSSSGEPVLVAAVSDGAGSAEKGADGAQLACSLWLSEIEALLQSGGKLQEIDKAFLTEWQHKYMLEVQLRANSTNLRPRDYACTFLAVAAGSDASVFCQIGDGAIVVEDRDLADAYCHVFWPQKGEYENQTQFLTDEHAADLLELTIEAPISEVILFTDGLQRLSLHYQSHTAFTPFFRAVVKPLRLQEALGEVDEVSKQLRAMLSSPQVNERTDDDKTLVIATMRYLPVGMAGEGADG